MIKKYLRWKERLSAGKQWLVCFIENLLFWSTGFFVLEHFNVFGLGKPWGTGRFLFQVTFMALFWTLSSNWKQTRDLVRTRRN
ncbi:MAG TPA: hypothetical protein PKE63_11070 [Lacibacter sp.]|nr:hypothetical protein [Lacibacter sp.]HMO88449.1 hypothetical protein [Lacibacter sp.]HMP87811.1 hypothetical protein [Lacibacter sp.]